MKAKIIFLLIFVDIILTGINIDNHWRAKKAAPEFSVTIGGSSIAPGAIILNNSDFDLVNLKTGEIIKAHGTSKTK